MIVPIPYWNNAALSRDSLGHGSGTLGCGVDCTWDFSGCEIGNSQCGSASACGSYSILKLQLGHMTAPAGDEYTTLKGTGLNGSGRTFDPRTEALALTFRDQAGSAASDAQTATAGLRIGNDCWEAESPCTAHGHGKTELCKDTQRSCPAS